MAFHEMSMLRLEKASYPADEAATHEKLKMRIEQVNGPNMDLVDSCTACVGQTWTSVTAVLPVCEETQNWA